MVRLPFDAHGWQFQQAVKGLARSFDLAATAISDAKDKAAQAIRDYQDHLDAGGDEIGEWDDEDGSTIWTQDQVLEWDMANVEEAAMALRKAYALQLYHLWERSAQAWTLSAPNTSHSILKDRTLANGHPVHERLEAVKHLANTLKHGNPKHGLMLLKAWSEVVQLPRHNDPCKVKDWYSAVTLTDAHVIEIALTVAWSGPQRPELANLFS